MEIQIFHQRQNNYKSISMWLECFFLRLHNHWVGVHFVGSVQCIHKGLYEWHPCQIDDFRCSNSIHETHSYFCFNYVQSRARDLVHIRKASDRKGRLLRENCILLSLCIFWWVVPLFIVVCCAIYAFFALTLCGSISDCVFVGWGMVFENGCVRRLNYAQSSVWACGDFQNSSFCGRIQPNWYGSVNEIPNSMVCIKCTRPANHFSHFDGLRIYSYFFTSPHSHTAGMTFRNKQIVRFILFFFFI